MRRRDRVEELRRRYVRGELFDVAVEPRMERLMREVFPRLYPPLVVVVDDEPEPEER